MTLDQAQRIVRDAGLGVPVMQHLQLGNRPTQAWITISVEPPVHSQIAAAIEALLSAARKDEPT